MSTVGTVVPAEVPGPVERSIRFEGVVVVASKHYLNDLLVRVGQRQTFNGLVNLALKDYLAARSYLPPDARPLDLSTAEKAPAP